MKVVINDVRLAFPALHEKDKFGRFSADFIFLKGHPAEKDISAAITKVAQEKWGAKAPQVLAALKEDKKLCLHPGTHKADYDGFNEDGALYVSTGSPTQPTLLRRNKEQCTPDDGQLYSGCYVDASLEIWAQDNGYGKRVNAQLSGVRFRRDGDAFSGGRPADPDEFEDLSDLGSDTSTGGGVIDFDEIDNEISAGGLI